MKNILSAQVCFEVSLPQRTINKQNRCLSWRQSATEATPNFPSFSPLKYFRKAEIIKLSVIGTSRY